MLKEFLTTVNSGNGEDIAIAKLITGWDIVFNASLGLWELDVF